MPILGASSRRLDGVGARRSFARRLTNCGLVSRARAEKNYEMGIHFRLDHRDERP